MQNHFACVWLFLLIMLFFPACTFPWGTNNRTDPFPLYTALDPQEFNFTRHREILHGWPLDKAPPQRVTLSLSGYGQAADTARLAPGPHQPTGTVCTTPNATTATMPCCPDVSVGDIDGKWNLPALLYGPLPQGQTYPPLLAEAREALFPNVPLNVPILGSTNVNPGTTSLADIDIDPTGQFGFISNSVKYRKFGLRWDFEAQLIGDFGFQFQGGIADIRQTVTCRVDLTMSMCGTASLDLCNASTFSGALVKEYLVDQLNDVATQMCLDICSFHAISVEDLYFCLYWRHAHEVNFNRDASWARFLAVPFFRLAGSVPSGKAKEPAVVFSVPFTNNGHPSVNINAGLNIDFTDTIQIGGEVGFSHFFARDVCCMHLPNSTFQSGLYPFQTTVNVHPGDTWYGAAKLNAYHFIDRLTFWGQWVLVKHREDTIKLLDCDPAFITSKCPRTNWWVQFFNAAFTYDISPNIALGFVWQFPLKWENAYKSNTVLFSFIASF